MKKDSIVHKQLWLYICTISVCMALLGCALTFVYTRHYMTEKKEELIRQGQKISLLFSESYRTGNLNDLGDVLQMLESYIGAGILVVNEDGVIIMASPGFRSPVLGESLLNEELVQSMLEDEIVVMQGKSGKLFDTSMLLVGYPVAVGQIAGVILCRPLPEIEASLLEMYQMSIVSLGFVFLLGLAVSYFTIKHIALPLMAMNRAAKVIANGNFDERVQVMSQDELGELAESFNHMAESLCEHEKTRRDLIANISHDLRSPLTSMQGFLTAMLDGTIPPERQEKYLRIVLEETQRLSRMTESIVDLSRAQSSSILLEETNFDVNELIRSNITVLEPQLTEKQVSMRVLLAQKETIVRGDEDKISRVIQNLLSNAAKFSPENGVIQVETTLTEKNKVLVSISDQGPGISAEDQKYIFDRFYKADATRNQDKEGSGIGLAIVREFLQAHGENITVKSEEGQGSTFTFSLKLGD